MELLAHLPPFQAEDFKFHLLDVKRCANLREYKAYLTDLRARYPKWTVENTDVSIEIQEKAGKAKSWVMMKHTGYPENCEREGLNIWFWKRNDDGVWVCHSHHGFRGAAPLPVPIEAPVPDDREQ